MLPGKNAFLRRAGKLLGGAGAGAVVVPQATIGTLNLVGFTSLGPAAGSMAAAIQSSIGCVAAGSPFAIAQSIAMGGLAGPLVATGAAVGVTAVLVSMALSDNKPSDNEPNPDGNEHSDENDGEGDDGEGDDGEGDEHDGKGGKSK